MPLLTKSELPRLYDIGLNGVGYLLCWEVDKELLSPWKQAYISEADDIYVEKRDNALEEMTENKLDRYYWRSQRSWDYGAGQQRFDVNLPGFPSNRAFLSSQGLDVFTTNSQATLLPSMTKIVSLTNQGPNAPQKIAVTDSCVYVASGQPNLTRFCSITGSDFALVSTATETAQEARDLASDGSVVYVALGPDGVHRDGVIVVTQREAFDNTTGYTNTGTPTLTADTTDKKEGTASLQVVTTAAATETKTFTGAPLDFSLVDNVNIWVKQAPPPSSSPTLRSTSANFTSSGANITLSAVNATTGDLQILHIFNVDPSKVPAPVGAGWLGQTNYISGGTAADVSGWLYTRTVTAADGTSPSVTVNANGATFVSSEYKILRGVDPGFQAEFNKFRTNGSASASSLNVGGITLTRDNTWLEGAAAQSSPGNNPILTYPFTTDASEGGVSQLASVAGHIIQNAGNSVSPTFTSDKTGPFIGIQAPFQAASGPAQQLEIRLQTDATNYFRRRITPPTGLWTLDRSILTSSDWVTVGAPNIAAINSFQLGQVGANTVHYDDLGTTSAAAFTHFSDPDYRTLGWCKDRLYGAGIKTGTQWAFREVGALATSKEWLVLPDGYTVGDIQELGSFVYFTANRQSVSKIYAFDGVNTPFIALTMPPGEQVTKLQPFLGAGLLIGARRSGMTNTSGQGVIYRAFPQSTGHLTAERVTTLGNASDGRDYAPQASSAYLDQVYLGTNYPESPDNAGLLAYFPTTGGFANHVEALLSLGGVVAAAAVYHNKKLFSIDGKGVWIESSSGALVSQGSLLSSVIDWNIDTAKVLMKGELATMPLPAGASARLDYSLDRGATFTTLSTSNVAGNTVLSTPLAATNIAAQIAQTRVTLTPDTTGLVSPILKKTGLAAIYGLKPRRIFKAAIKAYSYMNLKNGVPHPQQGVGLAAGIEKVLTGLRDTQTVVSFQPPGWGEEQQIDNPNIRVGTVKIHRDWQTGSGWSDICLCELFEVPN